MAGTPGTPSRQWYAIASLPTELQTWHPFPESTDTLAQGATLHYFNNWSGTATTPQYAYFGEALVWNTASGRTGLYRIEFGGYVANATVSTTPVPQLFARHVVTTQRVPGFATNGWYAWSDLPDELRTWTPLGGAGDTMSDGATLQYFTEWSPTATTAQWAYTGTARLNSTVAGEEGLYEIEFAGRVENASVSTTPVPELLSRERVHHKRTYGYASRQLCVWADMPPDLKAYHPFNGTTDLLQVAEITYFDTYDPNATHGQFVYKFRGLAENTLAGGLYEFTGYGYVENASVSEVARIRIFSYDQHAFGSNFTVTVDPQFGNNAVYVGTDTGGNGMWQLYNSFGNVILEGQQAVLDNGTTDGGAVISWTSAGGKGNVSKVGQFPIITATRNF